MSQEQETTTEIPELEDESLPPLNPDPENPTPGSRAAEIRKPEAPIWTPENPNCPQCQKPFKSNRAPKVHLRQWCQGRPDDTAPERPAALRIAVGERKGPRIAEAPPEIVEPEIPAIDLTVTPESVAAIMAAQGMVTNQLLAPGTAAWLWTQDEIDLIAPAAARMASRSVHAAKIAESQDAAAVVMGSAAYVVRNVTQGGIQRGNRPARPRRAHRPPGADHLNSNDQNGSDPASPGGEGGHGDAQPSPGNPGMDPSGDGGGFIVPDVGPKRGGWPA